jgi:hypothetical protein
MAKSGGIGGAGGAYTRVANRLMRAISSGSGGLANRTRLVDIAREAGGHRSKLGNRIYRFIANGN